MGADVYLVALGGVMAGVVGALMGLGGGIVAVPFLNLVVGVNMHVAAASGLISTLSVSCGATGRYLRRGGLVDVHQALGLELFAAAGGLLGGVAVGWLDASVLQLLFAVFLVYGAYHIWRSAGRDEARTGAVPLSTGRQVMTAALCFLAGILSGLLGIGGGIVVVPVLHLILALPFKGAAATSNFMMGLTAVPALCGFVARGQLDLAIAVPLAAGVLVGAHVGAWLMPRIRTRVLKLVFAGLLVLTAVEMARRGVATW